ncbi:MAG: hypothetical protein ABI832_00720 [bacterium]
MVSHRGKSVRMHLLALSSHVDWPFDLFNLWIETANNPDLLQSHLSA